MYINANKNSVLSLFTKNQIKNSEIVLNYHVYAFSKLGK